MVSDRLVTLLTRLNARRAAAGAPNPAIERRIEPRLGFPSARFGVYGTLRPGHENHHLLAAFPGRWREGAVRGRLHPVVVGENRYSALEWDPAGPPVAVWLLDAPGLPDHWPHFDRFEGPDYLRSLLPVELEDGEIVVANIYTLRPITRPSSPGAP